MGRDRCTLGFPYRARRAGLVFFQERRQRLGLPGAFSCPPGAVHAEALLAPTSHPPRGQAAPGADTENLLWEAHPWRSPAALLRLLEARSPVSPAVKGRNYPFSSSGTAVQVTPLLCWEKGLGRNSRSCRHPCPAWLSLSSESLSGCTEDRAVGEAAAGRRQGSLLCTGGGLVGCDTRGGSPGANRQSPWTEGPRSGHPSLHRASAVGDR